MRLVRADSMYAGSDAPSLPKADAVDGARYLAKRFCHLGLLEATLTPLPGSTSAIPRSGAHRTWLAMESLQVTGSFKVRGALHAIERRLAEFRARPGSDPAEPFVLYAASAGNHGAGVAFAAKHLGAVAKIVVPRGAPRTKLEKMKELGAQVIEARSTGYDGAEREAIELSRAHGVPFLSPYDDVDVLVGNGASLGFEIVRALGRVPDVAHCPIGGGGLATGLACAFDREDGGAARRAGRSIVVPLQSEASCAFAQSLERGSAVTELPPAATIAEGLEGGISAASFARVRTLIDRVIVCTEDEIERTMRFAARELGLLLEGSAAVALVPALDPAGPSSGARVREHADTTARGAAAASGTDTVIVLTGRNVDPERLMRIVAG